MCQTKAEDRAQGAEQRAHAAEQRAQQAEVVTKAALLTEQVVAAPSPLNNIVYFHTNLNPTALFLMLT